MTKKNRELIRSSHLSWRLFCRDGVYYADGRSNKPTAGKHSLATRTKSEALENLQRLDHTIAVRLGLVATEAHARQPVSDRTLSVAEGWEIFLENCARPAILGGTTEATRKRYRAIRDKHLQFCQDRELTDWASVTKSSTEKYGDWLARKGYADRTLTLELHTIVSVTKWLADEGHINGACRFQLRLGKIEGTDTYCYERKEVAAMLKWCQKEDSLGWLGQVLTCLATTGMRISEVAGLRWTDIDLESNTIQLTDERHSSRRRRPGPRRTTKGKRGRALPVHLSFRSILPNIKRFSDGYVFHGPRGGRLKPDTVRNVLVRDVIEPLRSVFPTPPGEIGFESGRIHSFRHYFVSEAFRQGATEAQIMAWVGHRDSNMVAHYRHLRSDDSQRTMQELNFLDDTTPDGPEQDQGSC